MQQRRGRALVAPQLPPHAGPPQGGAPIRQQRQLPAAGRQAPQALELKGAEPLRVPPLLYHRHRGPAASGLATALEEVPQRREPVEGRTSRLQQPRQGLQTSQPRLQSQRAVQTSPILLREPLEALLPLGPASQPVLQEERRGLQWLEPAVHPPQLQQRQRRPVRGAGRLPPRLRPL